jgi:hypothetical protein
LISVADEKLFSYLRKDTLSPGEQEGLEAELEFQSKEMKNKFASIACKTMVSLQKLEQQEEHGETCENLKVLIKHSYEHLCTLFEGEIRVNKLFMKLADHWSYFDYELLSLMINTYCGSELRRALEEYKSDLEKHCRCRSVDVPANVLKLKLICENTVQKEIKYLEVKLSQLLKKPLRLLAIKEGCIQLVFGALKNKENCELKVTVLIVRSLEVKTNS